MIDWQLPRRQAHHPGRASVNNLVAFQAAMEKTPGCMACDGSAKYYHHTKDCKLRREAWDKEENQKAKRQKIDSDDQQCKEKQRDKPDQLQDERGPQDQKGYEDRREEGEETGEPAREDAG